MLTNHLRIQSIMHFSCSCAFVAQIFSGPAPSQALVVHSGKEDHRDPCPVALPAQHLSQVMEVLTNHGFEGLRSISG